jgi:two-component system, OmpR family, response regulator
VSTPQRRALVVEDDQALALIIAELLSNEGFAVQTQPDGDSGFEAAITGDFDVIILDVMLPKRNGFKVCADVRALGVDTPLLMLTAKDGDLDEIEGLEAGADDFLRKPFERAKLLAHINALIRRSERHSNSQFSIGNLHINAAQRRVELNGVEVSLTPREFSLLEFLITRPGETKTKSDILNAVWGHDFDGDPNIIEVYVGYLRRKIDQPGQDSLIHTVRGVGYNVRTA